MATPEIPGRLIIGVGNAFRRDDGVGPWIAEQLQSVGFRVRLESGEGASLIDCWDGEDNVLVIDAARSGAEPGTIHRFDCAETSLPTGFFHYSTHQFGLAEAVETARHLGSLPRQIKVIAIEGFDFGSGEGLSADVEQAAKALLADFGNKGL